VHFTRLSASGSAGTHSGQDERTRSQIASLDEATRLMAMISPQSIVLAHTATSYSLGREAEETLVRRLEVSSGARFVTAFGGAVAALRCLGARRIAYATHTSPRTVSTSWGWRGFRGSEIFTTKRRPVHTRLADRLIGLKQRLSF
jgi:maleate cis-trans isomerase